MRAARLIATLAASVPLRHAHRRVERRDGDVEHVLHRQRLAEDVISSPAPSLSGMPLQKSDANCSSAKPRAKYISRDVRRRRRLVLVEQRRSPGSPTCARGTAREASLLTVELFSWIWRWSVSSFWTNVELVAHSSTSRPPNSHVLSPSAVAVRSRDSAPLRTAVAPAGRLHRRRIDDRRVDGLEEVVLDGVARREPADGRERERRCDRSATVQ